MKRLLIPFIALALCPPAQAWEYLHPDDGYKACTYTMLSRYTKQEWNKETRDEKVALRAWAHDACK